MSALFTTAELEAYLEEALPSERMVEIENAMRDTPELARQLTSIAGKCDAGLHTLGAIWRRHRLTCPSREKLGGYLLGVLEPAECEYLRFHLDTMQCRYCSASLADLGEQHDSASGGAALGESAAARRTKYFQSSAGYLSSKG